MLMLAQKERDNAFSALESKLFEITNVYRECYLSKRKGAILVHAKLLISGHLPSPEDYRTKKEIIEIFDDINSKASLAELVDNYEPRTEGIMVLITSVNNTTYFVTVKLKSRLRAD